MQIKSKKSKIIIFSLTTASAVAIVVPIGVVFGQKSDTESDTIKYFEETDDITVQYGQPLAAPANRVGYKVPILDEKNTNYTTTTEPEQTGIIASYYFEVDGTDNNLKPIHLT